MNFRSLLRRRKPCCAECAQLRSIRRALGSHTVRTSTRWSTR